jgi:hypothetical protein
MFDLMSFRPPMVQCLTIPVFFHNKNVLLQKRFKFIMMFFGPRSLLLLKKWRFDNTSSPNTEVIYGPLNSHRIVSAVHLATAGSATDSLGTQ